MKVCEQLDCYGTSDLSTAELLAFALTGGREQKNTLARACKLLEAYGIKWLRNANVGELRQIAGFTAAQAARLKAVCELTNRFAILEPEARTQIKSADDVAVLLRPLMAHLDHEEFRVLVLNIKNIVIANVVLYVGTVDGAQLRAAEVFRQAIVRNCPKIIIAHLHPSGDPTASDEDVAVTQQLVEAGMLLDVELLDHIIIGNPKYVSLKEQMRW